MAHIVTVPRKVGVAYEVHFRTGTAKRRKTFSVRRDAERFALKVESEIAAGRSTAPLARQTKTFATVAAECFEAERPRLKQKTLDSYDLALRVHVLPALGARRIATITAADLDRFIADLRAKPKANGKPRSETSVLGTYKAVAKVLGFAFKHQHIPFNPCVAVARPKPDTAEAMFLSVEEVGALAAQLAEQQPFDLIVRTAALTGLRAGELAALRIRDLDLLHGFVHVRRTMSHTSAGYLYTTPKTERSVRDVPILDDGLWTELRDHLSRHPRGDDPDAGLWPGKVPGHAIVSYDHLFDPKGFYRYTFKPAARRAGFPDLKLHELRHTFATLALEAGIDMYELSRLMGHSSYAITDRVYSHLRRKDYSAQRAAFSAHIAAGHAEPVAMGTLRA